MRWIVTVAKVLLSALLIGYIFSRIDLSSALDTLRALSPVAVAITFALLALQVGVATFRLQRLLVAVGRKCEFGTVLDAVLVGSFFSQTLISFVGGDAMRIWRISRRGLSVNEVARAVLYDRIFGFIGLILLILIGIPILFHVVHDARVRSAIVALIVVAAAACLVLLAIQRFEQRIPRSRAFGFLVELSATGYDILRSGWKLWEVIGLAALIQILNVLIVYSLARGLGVEVSFLHCLVLVPPVLFLSMMPISFAGWGVREGAMVAALGAVSVPSGQSLAISISYGIALAVASVPGGVLWLVKRRHRPTGTVIQSANNS